MIKVGRIASLLSGSLVIYAPVGTAQVLSSPNLLPTTTLAPKAFGRRTTRLP